MNRSNKDTKKIERIKDIVKRLYEDVEIDGETPNRS